MLDRNNYLYVAFVDLEKAFDRVPREVLCWCPIVSLVKEMYNGATTRVRTECDVPAKFRVTVVLHQGAALSPFQCGVVVDREILTNNFCRVCVCKM